MINSAIIRKELSKYRENEIIFASTLYKEKLYKQNVSESSFYKLLERMYKAKQLEKISKGIYYFPKKGKYGFVPISNEEIISFFTNNKEGMVVGYNLYNKLNLTTQISKNYIVYSSKAKNEIKRIRNVEIRNINMKYSEEYIRIIELLEVLQNFHKIQDINFKIFYKYVKSFANTYDEKKVNIVLEKIKYKKSTISFLSEVLNHFEVENNLDSYLSKLSKYNHMHMEDIYELTQSQERF